MVVSYRKPEAFTLESSLYATYQKDAILWQSSGGIWRPDNIGEAFFFGSDTTVKSIFIATCADPLLFLSKTYVLTDDLASTTIKECPNKPVQNPGLGVTFSGKRVLTVTEHYYSDATPRQRISPSLLPTLPSTSISFRMSEAWISSYR
jgi:hypothetical protein